jgi:hypothetical protein
MSEQRIDAGKAPHIIVNCHGDLWVRAWAETTILAKGDSFTAKQGEKGVEVMSNGSLKLYLPLLSSLTVSQTGGDLRIKGLDGQVTLVDVHGDLHFGSLNDVTVKNVNGDVSGRDLSGPLFIETVHGDLILRNVSDLEVGQVNGDCLAAFVNGKAFFQKIAGDINLKTINGDVSIEECHRDVNLRNLGGQTSVELAHGDIRLHGGLSAGKHNLEADGDIVVRWPLSAPLQVEATAPTIQNRMDLSDLDYRDGFLGGRIGDGQTFLILSAKGRIILKEASSGQTSWEDYAETDYEFEVDLNGLGEHIASEINDRMQEWSIKLESELGPTFAANLEKSVLKAADQAERAAEKAMRKAEKAARKARWQSGQNRWTASPVSTPSGAKEKKASEEEQLKILRMVEQGIITPEEANSLLEAIEG